MKDWNKEFYQSNLWQKCRESYLITQNHICERCGEIAKIVHHKTYLNPANITDLNITLSHENLEALCQTCHNTEHHKAEPKAGRYTFDTAGNIIPPPITEK
jgi:5-methylcytosine-specific restriction endonuclease McrA